LPNAYLMAGSWTATFDLQHILTAQFDQGTAQDRRIDSHQLNTVCDHRNSSALTKS
jgi:hypothetical protein